MNELQREYEQACKRLQSLIEKGADDYEVMRAKREVDRLFAKLKKRREKWSRKPLDRDGDDW